MRSIVIFRFFSHLSLLFVYQCITFLPLIFRFSFYTKTIDLCTETFGYAIFFVFCTRFREAVARFWRDARVVEEARLESV